MPFDDDADEERPGSGVPLPPEDRLWRHPSELGPGGAGFVPGSGNPLAAPWPLSVFDPSGPRRHRWRGSWASIAAVSCLAGAVIAMGLVLATRPDPKVVDRGATQRATLQPITSVVWRQFPT